MAMLVPGSESATIHEELAATLSALTSIVVEFKEQAPGTLLKAICKWRKWLLKQPATEV